jgi:hypothetical protein
MNVSDDDAKPAPNVVSAGAGNGPRVGRFGITLVAALNSLRELRDLA